MMLSFNMLTLATAIIAMAVCAILWVVRLFKSHKYDGVKALKAPFYVPLAHDPHCDSVRGGPRSANRSCCRINYLFKPEQKRQYYKGYPRRVYA